MTTPASDRNPRKRPRQSRSRATFDAIVAAAAHIVEREGPAAATTNAIAERAGASIGSLYQYFPTREAILVELIRRKRAALRAEFDAALAATAGRPLDERVGPLLAAAIRHQYLTPNLARLVETANERLALEAEARELEAHMAAGLTRLIEAEGIGEPERAAGEIVAITRAMIAHAAQGRHTDRAALCARVRLAVLAYLGALGGPRRD